MRGWHDKSVIAGWEDGVPESDTLAYPGIIVDHVRQRMKAPALKP